MIFLKIYNEEKVITLSINREQLKLSDDELYENEKGFICYEIEGIEIQFVFIENKHKNETRKVLKTKAFSINHLEFTTKKIS